MIPRNRLKQFLERVTFGFEFELDFTEYAFISYPKTIYIILGKEEPVTDIDREAYQFGETLKKNIRKFFPGVKFDGGFYHEGKERQNKEKNVFRIEIDPSINGLGSIELITPPISYQKAIKIIPEFVTFLEKEYGVEVDCSHGWHIHISEEDKKRFAKVRDFFEELANGKNIDGKSSLYYLANLITKFSDISYVLTDPERAEGDYARSLANAFESFVTRNCCTGGYIDNIAATLEHSFVLNRKLEKKIENLVNKGVVFYTIYCHIDIPLNSLVDGYIRYTNIGNDLNLYEVYETAQNIFRNIYMETHYLEVRLVSSHGGMEHRVPGGSNVIETYKDRNKFKKILLDTLQKYYLILYIDEAKKQFNDEAVMDVWNEYIQPVLSDKIEDKEPTISINIGEDDNYASFEIMITDVQVKKDIEGVIYTFSVFDDNMNKLTLGKYKEEDII